MHSHARGPQPTLERLTPIRSADMRPRALVALSIPLALLATFAPTASAARGCPGYVDFHRVRAFDGVPCSTVRGMQRALYEDGGFNAASGSRQALTVYGDTWICRWRSGPRVRCRNQDGRGAWTARLRVG